jgi:predicted RecA/RadA family phage recombinase
MATGTLIDSAQNTRTLKLAHTAAVAQYEVIVSNNIVLIALNAALINTANIYAYTGKVTLPKAAPLVIGVGDIVYWDVADGNVNKSSSGNTMCGFCIAAAASADTTVDIYLFPDLTNLGATELANDSADGDVVAVDVLKVVTVNLTNAQIKGLRAAPKTLVAAPGATKWLEFLSAQLILDYGSEVLTESADNMAIRYTNGSGAIVSQAIEATGFIDASADTYTNALPKIDAIVAAASALNQALVLHNTGDGEYGGNATSDTLMKVRIAYREHTNPLI